MRFKLILASVKTDITDRVVDRAKESGATGATIIPARGTGIKEAKTFFGLTMEAQTDIIMFLVEEHLTEEILGGIREAGKFHKPGTGIAFVLPIDKVVGLESQIKKFEEQARKSYF